MTYQQNKMLNLSFNLFNYWRPSSWSDPQTPTSWKCTIAEIIDKTDHILIDNFITMETTYISTTKDMITHLKSIDKLLSKKIQL